MLALSVAADKHLVLIPGRGHNNLVGDPGYWHELHRFVAAHAG